MDIEKKRMLFFGSILGLAIIGSVVLFFWGNLINRGTLIISGDAPFKVEIIDILTKECPVSPCSIKTKSGDRDLMISKSGFQSILASAKVKLWRTTNLPIKFQIIPHIEETDEIPEPEKKLEYELVMDNKIHMQKLIRKGQLSSEALAYFSKPITKSQIIGARNTVLVADLNYQENTSYIIDLNKKSRISLNIDDLKDIGEGKWSDDSKFLVFTKKDSPLLWLLNVSTRNITPLKLTTNLKYTSWDYKGDLIFASDQAYSSIGDAKINLLNEKSTIGLTFGLYNPTTNIYEKFGSFPEAMSLPEEFITTSNGAIIYFQSDKKNFRIILRKF